ncbi:hypothetical protein GCM10011390_10320 [Aureimonas endophytica]|uniref:Uncharacterized protein n=1 Tax=Aureimonas endophytica TaxID=2027858 RepID=A0A917E132_9HYPH|nr:hypothetical protein [Aureimonas endophytica]GGD93480.1 hypothetical protein GCM10011390_10320 [Aureimonas endophytica]
MRDHFGSIRRRFPAPAVLPEAATGAAPAPADDMDAWREFAPLDQDQLERAEARTADRRIEVPQDAAAKFAEEKTPQRAAFLDDRFEREKRVAIHGEPAPEAYRAGAQTAENQPQTPAATGFGGGDLEQRRSPDRFQLRPAGWRPEPGPGITLTAPAIEVGYAEYDRHLDALIAAQPVGSAEAYRLLMAKKKGWVVDRGGERIFVRGRL